MQWSYVGGGERDNSIEGAHSTGGSGGEAGMEIREWLHHRQRVRGD